MMPEESEQWQIDYLNRRVRPSFIEVFAKKDDLPIGELYSTILHVGAVECALELEIRTQQTGEVASKYLYSIASPKQECLEQAKTILDSIIINDDLQELESLVTEFNRSCEDRSFVLQNSAGNLELKFSDDCGIKRSLLLNRSAIVKFIRLSHLDLSVFFEYPFAVVDPDGWPTLESFAAELVTRYIDYSSYIELDELQYDLVEKIKRESKMACVCMGNVFLDAIKEQVDKIPMPFIEQQKKKLIEEIVEGNPGMPF